jgi:hypothetical protein
MPESMQGVEESPIAGTAPMRLARSDNKLGVRPDGTRPLNQS